jgi:hypothetical protein
MSIPFSARPHLPQFSHRLAVSAGRGAICVNEADPGIAGEAADSMSEPFPGNEDRAADVKPERVVFEGTPVLGSHQELDQALVARVHLFLADREADSGSVDDREIVGHGRVEADEAVIEDPELVWPFARPDLGPLVWPSI